MRYQLRYIRMSLAGLSRLYRMLGLYAKPSAVCWSGG